MFILLDQRSSAAHSVMLLSDVNLLPQAIRMSERSEQCSVRVVYGRAELSELRFRDKAKSTLLSINGALIGQTVTWEKRPYSNG